MSTFHDAATIQQKALELIDRHLTQLLEGGPVANGSAITIQNYAKTLAMVAKDQRDAARGFNAAELSDEELARLTEEAKKHIQEPDNASSDETSGLE